MITYNDQALLALQVQFEQAPAALLNEIEQEIDQQLGPFLVERVKANVPYNTGNLASHVRFERHRQGDRIELALIADTSYAVEVHEKPGTPDGSTPEGGRGPKYFERVLDAHQQEIQSLPQQAIQQVMKSTS